MTDLVHIGIVLRRLPDNCVFNQGKEYRIKLFHAGKPKQCPGRSHRYVQLDFANGIELVSRVRRAFEAAIVVSVLAFSVLAKAAIAQPVMPLWEKGGLHAAYVVPRDDFNRVDVQLIVLSGANDDPQLSGIAHLTEHLAAFSSDNAVLRRARERDLNAVTHNVSTVYTNSGPPQDIELLLQLSRAVLDPPKLRPGFAESEIKILHRETFLRERQSPYRWLRRKALQNLYGTLHGRANNTVEDLDRLNLDMARQFHATHYVPSNVTLIISGDIKPAKAAQLQL